MLKLNVEDQVLVELTSSIGKILSKYKLGGSDVFKSIEMEYKDDTFTLIANDYLQWIDKGRKPHTRKVPAIDIIKWMKKKGITPKNGQTYNSTAYAIVEGIYKHGIKARNIITPITELSLDFLSEYIAESLSEEIADQLIKSIEINQ